MPDVFDSKARKEKQALDHLFPDKEDLPDKIGIITTTRGKAPTIKALYQAKFIFALLDSMEGRINKKKWDDLDMSYFYELHAPSLGGRHADRAVEISRAAPNPTVPLSWVDRLMGKAEK